MYIHTHTHTHTHTHSHIHPLHVSVHLTSSACTGETVVLTLADQRVVTGARNAYGSAGVNDDEDELENVNIAEFQKTATAKARAAQKKYYDATDDSEFTGEGGMARIRQRSLILLC